MFMEELKEFAREHAPFCNARDTYNGNLSAGIPVCREKSNVKDTLAVADEVIKDVEQKLKEIAAIQINIHNVVSLQSQLSVQRKSALLADAVLKFPLCNRSLLTTAVLLRLGIVKLLNA